MLEDGAAGGALDAKVNGSRYRVERGAGDRRVDVDEPEQTAQAEEREHERLLEVDRVLVAAPLDVDAAGLHRRVQRRANAPQQQRVVEAAAGRQQSQRPRAGRPRRRVPAVRQRRTLRRHGTSDLLCDVLDGRAQQVSDRVRLQQ